MNVILEILKNYWKEIISVVLFIVSVIVAIIRKKPVNDVISYIYEYCVRAVNKAEHQIVIYDDKEINLKGDDKLDYAVSQVKADLKAIFPRLDVSVYDFMIEAVIESILSTPQKKER